MQEASRILFFIMLSLAAGCTVGPNFHRVSPPNITRYTADPIASETVETKKMGGGAQKFISGPRISERVFPMQWWQVFQCEALDNLIAEALTNSPTLASAKAKLRQAQEEFNAQLGTSRYPAIDGSIAATRQQVNFQALGISAIPSPPPFTLYNIGASVSYTFDFFGANRRQLEALQAAVDFQQFELTASRLTLAANIVTAVIRTASLRDQIKITQEIIALQQNQLKITEQRLLSGGVAQLDVSNQNANLAQTKASLAPLQKQLEQTRHLIAVYLGKAPSASTIPEIYLSDLQLPSTLPVSLPSELIRQRPDILAAEALLHQAYANVGVATANLFPKLTITGNLATEATAIKNLFHAGSSVWNIGPTLMQPIFHGGALLAKRRSAVAALDQAIAAYQETVLQGIQNVADTLQALHHDAKELAARTVARNEAHDTFNITSKLYQAGGVSYISLLDSQRQYIQSQLEQVQSIANRYADSAALFQALGGGWDHNESVQCDATSANLYPTINAQ